MNNREIYEAWIKTGWTKENFTFMDFERLLNREPWMDKNKMAEVLMFEYGYRAGFEAGKMKGQK